MVWLLDDPEEELELIARGERRTEVLRRAAEQTSPEQVARVIHFAQMAPHASPGLVVGSAMSGLDPSAFARLAEQDDGGHGDQDQSWFRSVTEGAFGLTKSALWDHSVEKGLRGLFALSETLFEEVVQRPLVSAFEAGVGEDAGQTSFGEAYTGYGNSVGVNFAQGLLDGPGGIRADLGSGLLPAGVSGARAQQQREASGQLLGGQQTNLGRIAAHNTVRHLGAQPGERAYDLTAGIFQFAAEVFLDPANLLTGGVAGGARAAARESVEASSRLAKDLFVQVADMRNAQLAEGVIGSVDEFVVPDEFLQQAVGLVQGHHANRTVMAERALPFLRDPDVLQAIADADAYTLRDAFARGRGAQGLFDMQRTIGRLGEASTREDVAFVLAEQMAHGWKPTERFYTGWRGSDTLVTGRVGSALFDSKFAGIAPTGYLSARNMPDAIEKLDSLMRQAKVPREARAGLYGRGALLENGDGIGLRNYVKDVRSELLGVLAPGDMRVRQLIADTLSDHTDDLVEAIRQYDIDEVGHALPGVTGRETTLTSADGTVTRVADPGPHISSELSDEFSVMLPDPGDIRRAAIEGAVASRFFNSPYWTGSEAAARVVTTRWFKPPVLTRPAFFARVTPEAMGRMAADGYETALSGPTAGWRYLMTAVKDQNLATDLLGENLEQSREAVAALNANFLADAGGKAPTPSVRGWTQVHRPTSEMLEAGDIPTEVTLGWRWNLGHLADAPEVSWLARNGDDVDGLVERYFARSTDTLPDRQMVEQLDRLGATTPQGAWTRDTLRAEAQTWVTRLNRTTGGNPRLREWVARSTDEVDLSDRAQWDKAEDMLRPMVGEWMPQTLPYHDGLKDWVERTGGSVLRQLMNGIISKPETALARFPMWRQSMGRTLEDMLPAMTPQVRAQVVDKLPGLRLPEVQVARITERAAALADEAGFIEDITFVNDTMKARAADDVKRLLFDNTNQSAFQQEFVAITPFVDAWREAITTWASLVRQKPEILTNFARWSRAATDTGVVYTDENGERRFATSGTSVLAGALAGAGVGARVAGGAGAAVGSVFGALGGTVLGAAEEGFTRESQTGQVGDVDQSLTFRAEGVNLALGSIGPGFGPIVQWPAGAFIPRDGPLGAVAEFISPFTTPIESGADLLDPTSFANAAIPAWARRFLNGLSKGRFDEVAWNQTIHDSLRHIELSGNYTPEQLADPDFAEEIRNKVTNHARWMLMVRGFGQATLVTGPSVETRVRTQWTPEDDRDGVWHSVSVMTDEWYRLLEQTGDPNVANQRFIAMYGIEPWWFTTSKTRVVEGGRLESTTQARSWLQDNRQLADRYGFIAGYLTPVMEGDDPNSYSIYREQIASGEREFLTIDQQKALANSARARQMFHNVRVQLEGRNLPPETVESYLGLVTGVLEQQFPGWKDPIQGLGNIRDSHRIAQFEQAAFDPGIEASPIAPALRVYFTLRNRLRDDVRQGLDDPSATLRRREAAAQRDYLRRLGVALSQRSPEFRAAWRVLESELEVG